MKEGRQKNAIFDSESIAFVSCPSVCGVDVSWLYRLGYLEKGSSYIAYIILA